MCSIDFFIIKLYLVVKRSIDFPCTLPAWQAFKLKFDSIPVRPDWPASVRLSRFSSGLSSRTLIKGPGTGANFEYFGSNLSVVLALPMCANPPTTSTIAACN